MKKKARQKHHEKVLAKAKKRSKRGQNMILKKKVKFRKVEKIFKESQERLKGKKERKALLKLRIWFISLRPIVWIRKVENWYSERKYKG